MKAKAVAGSIPAPYVHAPIIEPEPIVPNLPLLSLHLPPDAPATNTTQQLTTQHALQIEMTIPSQEGQPKYPCCLIVHPSLVNLNVTKLFIETGCG